MLEKMRGGVLMIYCVEDDASIRELVLYTLRASGFEARGFAESGAPRRNTAGRGFCRI